MPAIFYRSSFSEVWITLRSDEPLGLMDSDYLEDYFGTDSQVTLYHPASGTRYPVLMAAQPLETPTIPNDVFKGYRLLSSLPDGLFQLQFRVRDLVGNYTTVGQTQTQQPSDRFLTLDFEVRPGALQTKAVPGGSLVLEGGLEGGVLAFGATGGLVDGSLDLASIPEGGLLQYPLEVVIQ